MLIGDNAQLVARQTGRHLSPPGSRSAIVPQPGRRLGSIPVCHHLTVLTWYFHRAPEMIRRPRPSLFQSPPCNFLISRTQRTQKDLLCGLRASPWLRGRPIRINTCQITQNRLLRVFLLRDGYIPRPYYKNCPHRSNLRQVWLVCGLDPGVYKGAGQSNRILESP